MNDNTQQRIVSLTEIKAILPHRPPFLFVDKICAYIDGQSIMTEKYISAQEYFLNGHFPGRPIMPGVLISEALAQTCGLLVGLTIKTKSPTARKLLPTFALTSIDMKFLQAVLPESKLVMQAVLQKQFGGLFRFSVKATVNDTIIAKGILSLGEFGDNNIG